MENELNVVGRFSTKYFFILKGPVRQSLQPLGGRKNTSFWPPSPNERHCRYADAGLKRAVAEGNPSPTIRQEEFCAAQNSYGRKDFATLTPRWICLSRINAGISIFSWYISGPFALKKLKEERKEGREKEERQTKPSPINYIHSSVHKHTPFQHNIVTTSLFQAMQIFVSMQCY